MPVSDQIRPVNGKHSIKEAVLSLFLPNPIIKPERFKDLIEGGFKTTFQQFEPISHFIAEIKNERGVVSNSFQTIENIGFKYTSFNKGKVDTVLQALNQPNRYFISYHELNYTRWENFFKSFNEVLNVVNLYEPSIFVNAFSLHYIDEFHWIDDKQPINPSVIFASNSKYLPAEFFQSGKSNFTLVTERNLPDQTRVFDRIEIKVEPAVVPLITVSHNITYPLTDFVSLATVIGEGFAPYFDKVHVKNKDLLRDLLNPDVLKLIGI